MNLQSRVKRNNFTNTSTRKREVSHFGKISEFEELQRRGQLTVKQRFGKRTITANIVSFLFSIHSPILSLRNGIF